MKLLGELLVLILLLGHPQAGTTSVPVPTATPQPVQVLGASQVTPDPLFYMINNQRTTKLTYSSALARSAQRRACDLAKTQAWTHTEYESYIYKSGYKITPNVTWIGENLARNFGSSQPLSDQEVLNLWLNSSEHRANILDSFKYISIGIGKCGNYTVAHFGGRS